MKLAYIFIALVIALVLVGCASQDISAIKKEDNVGTEVRVQGVVDESIKIGDLSGFILKDSSGDTIGVATDTLPAEEEEVTVEGTLIRDTIFGYYIQT